MADEPAGTQAPVENAAPYAEYLDKIPEELREQVEPVFKEWDGNVTKRFTEASDFRKQWEPFADIPQEEMQWLAAFRQAQSDPQQIAQWYEQYAAANGLAPQEPEQPQYGDPDIAALLQQQFEQHLTPLQQQLGALTQWREEQEQGVRTQAAERQIETQITAMTEKHGEVSRELLDRFVGPYIQSDPEHAVERAYGDYAKFVAQIEKQTLTQKLGQAPGAESGGSPATTPEPITTLAQAAEIARQRLQTARD